MSFLHLPVGWVIAGLAVLAAGLFALQRLRVRHRDVTVITTMFWAEAVRESRARVLVDRFRHPLAYLLILAAASLLWIGAAGPRWTGGAGREQVLLLDASARMGRPGRFAAAVETLRADVAALPRDRTRVVLCGATPRTLLLPGENALLLDERLAGLHAEPVPESVSQTLHELLTTRDGPVTVRVHGDAPLPGAGDLDADALVLRAGPGPIDGAANVGVTALGVTDARSGAWTAVDVFVEVSGSPLPEPGDVTVALSGTDTDLPAPEVTRGEGRLALRFFDVPATGATVTVTLAGGDALALDDTASLVLPSRAPIRVSLTANVPPALRTALANDRAVQLVGDRDPADVHVVRNSLKETRADGAVPALILGNGSNGSFGIGGPDVNTLSGGNEREIALAAVRELALDRIDATALATQAGVAITVSAWKTEEPVVMVSEELLSEQYDFVADDAFPAFVAGAVRRLAGVREPTLDSAETGALVSSDETAAITVGQAGDTSPAGGAPSDLAAWAGLVAAALLAAEWVLHRRGRIP